MKNFSGIEIEFEMSIKQIELREDATFLWTETRKKIFHNQNIDGIQRIEAIAITTEFIEEEVNRIFGRQT